MPQASRRTLIRDISGLVGQYGFYAVVHALVDICYDCSGQQSTETITRGEAGWLQLCRVLRYAEQLVQRLHLDIRHTTA